MDLLSGPVTEIPGLDGPRRAKSVELLDTQQVWDRKLAG